MRIARLDLLRYGKFADRALALPASAGHDLHIVLGPNEAGKSTTRNAIADLLFRIPGNTPYGFLHGMPDMRLGAVLEHGGATLEFQRRKGNKGTLLTAAGTALTDAELQPFLGATDRVFFERMFGLDLARLVEGGSALLSAADDVGQMLFRSAAGLSGLGDVAQRLEAEAETLWGPRRKADRAYTAAADDLEAAERDLKTATVKAKDWAQLHSQLQAAEQAHENAKALHAQLRGSLRVTQRIRRSRPALDTLHGLEAQLQALGSVPLLPPEAAATLAQAQATMARCATEADQHQAAQVRTQAEQAALQLDPTLLAAEPEVADLHARRLRCADHPAGIQAASGQIAAEWARAQTLAQQLGWPADSEAALQARLPSLPLRSRLQALKDRQAMLQQALQHKADAHTAKTREAEGLREQLRSAAGAVSTLPAALEAALAQARRLGDTQATKRQLQQALDKARQAQARAGAALRLGEQAFDDEARLLAVTLPGDAAAHQQLAAEQQDAADARAASQAIQEAADQVAQLTLQIQQFSEAHSVVTLDQLQTARAARDTLWQALVAAPETLPAQARQFEQHLQRSDELADRRHDTARDASTLQTRRQQLQAAQLSLAQAQARLQAVQQARAARQAAWAALVAQAGVPGLTADQLPDWRRQRSAALDCGAASADAQRALQTHQAACAAAAQALHAAWVLAAPGSTLQPLDTLIEQAQALVQAAANAQGRRASWAEQLMACERALQPLHEDWLAAKQSSDDWQLDWAAALNEAGLPAASAAAEVAGVLGSCTQIDAALQAIATLRVQRVEAPRVELDTLAQRAQALAARLAPALQGQPPEAIASELQARLETARLAQAQATRLAQVLQETQTRLQQARSRHDAAAAELQPLLQRAGLASTAEVQLLAQAVERSDTLRRLTQQRAQAEQALTDAGDGLTLAELRAEAANSDPATLMTAVDELGQQEAEVVERLGTLAVARERQQQALDAVGGSAAAAQAEARRQDALARMTEAVERYVAVATAARLLRWAIERFRETQQGPMLAAASTAFQQLTGGSFERLVVDFEQEPPTLEGRRADGTLVPVAGMSDGTRDQLFLALRLAALDLHLEAGHAMPFIADDLFVNFDDSRSRAGLQALATLSQRTQVIYLTHHHHLAELARDTLRERVHIVEL